MVAESEKAPKQITLTERRIAGNQEIPLMVRLQARNLYLNGGMSWEEIGIKCNWNAKSLATIACKYGWVAEKRRRASLLEKKLNARLEAETNQAIEAIAEHAEQHALGVMHRVGESIANGNARDFQAYTAGVRNLATTAKALRETNQSAMPTSQVSFNLFMVGAAAPAAQSEPKQVTPIPVQ